MADPYPSGVKLMICPPIDTEVQQFIDDNIDIIFSA